MFMPFLKVKITKLISKDQPGFVECSFLDAHNKEWIIHEKAPVVSEEDIDENTNFPKEGYIAAEIIKQWKDEKGRQLVTIDTDNPWRIGSIDGKNHFDVCLDQIMESEVS
jgi:hypothetical protein